jgi:phage baseplate assembly protein W
MRESKAFRRNILGYGLTWPLRRLASSDFVAAEGEALVRSCIAQILGTRPGELPWRPDFGIDLEHYRHHGNSQALAKEIALLVASALQDWEPRVSVSSCSATIEAAEEGSYTQNVIRVRVNWAVVSGATPSENNVLIGPVSQEVAL